MVHRNNSSPGLLVSRASVASCGSSSSSDGAGPMGGSGDGSPTTPDDLKELLSDRYYGCQIPCRHYDEVAHGLFLGDMKTARNVLTLEKLGITHVLNAAYTPSPFTDRATSDAYYRERNFPCEFLGVPAQDFPSYKITQWFDECSQFIHDGLKVKGRVFVHCQVGVSRSATLVIAYFMTKHKMPPIDAVQLVGPIFPNDGFLKQICELDYRLSNTTNALLRTFSVMSRRTLSKLLRSPSSVSSSTSSSSSSKTKAMAPAMTTNNNEGSGSSSVFAVITKKRSKSLPQR